MYFYITGAITFILVYIIYELMKWYFSPYRQVPSPFAWPFIGHTLDLYGKDTLTVYSNWAEKYKDEGLFRLNLPNFANAIFLLKQEHQKEILTNSSKFVKTNTITTFVPLAGKGLFTAAGDHHTFQRKLLTKAFSMVQVNHYIPVFDKHASILVKIWQCLVKDSDTGENIDVKHHFSSMAFDIIGEIGFGYQFNSQTTTNNKFTKAYREQTQELVKIESMLLLKYLPFLWYVPFGPAKVLKDATRASEDILEMVIRTRKEKIAAENLTEVEEKDLLSTMMKVIDKKTGEGFSDQLIKDNIYSFFLAGYESTSSTLAGILMYLAQYPEHQEQCRKEINEALLSTEEVLNVEQLNLLPFTSAFIKESIRLFTAAPQLSRVSVDSITIGKYCFPKNTIFIIPVFLSNKDEDHFDDSNEFRPERYLENSDIKTGTLFTFGYGPRNCIGKNFTMQKMKIVIVRLLQNFRFSIDPGNDKFVRKVRLTLATVPNIKIRVQAL